MDKPIKVMIVDDSPLMRKILTSICEQDSRLSVVGTARNGEVALDRIKEYDPDVVTMDVQMPKMDGLATLKAIIKAHPVPVVMISSVTQKGAQQTFDCLDAGAVDFVDKPSGGDPQEVEQKAELILDKIVNAAQAKHISRLRLKHTSSNLRTRTENLIDKSIKSLSPLSERAVAIGISTGGPVSIMEVIPELPANLPCPVFMVQHMPPGFTKSFAQRLNDASQVRVVEAESGDEVLPGTVYLAPGGLHMTVIKSLISSKVKIRISQIPKGTLHCPSVDVMMSSVAKVYGRQTLGIIMTGMGSDGSDGMTEIKKAGGQTIAEHESSCVIYGMPKAVAERGVVDAVVPLHQIAGQITRRVGT
jgi:two-component system chemotaxis response regulator CheB